MPQRNGQSIMMRFLVAGVIVLIFGFSGSANSFRTYNVDQESKTVTYQTDGDLNMILIGDWGGMPFCPYYMPFEMVTAKQLMKKAKLQNSDFVLSLGDNFYFRGVTDEYDLRFQNSFENVYNDEGFQSVPWFVLAGNHDHYGNITGQIEYSKHSERWIYPSLWYTIKAQTPTYNVTIIMIDTIHFCGQTLDDMDDSQPDIDTRDQKAFADQLQYIEDQLKDNKDSYVFVAGHYPVWSVAAHGPTQCLLDDLNPLLEKYGASAYICAHDHNLQHIKTDDSEVHHILSGAGEMVLPMKIHYNSVPEGASKFYSAELMSLGGFATLHLSEDSATVVYEAGNGETLYKHEFNSRK